MKHYWNLELSRNMERAPINYVSLGFDEGEGSTIVSIGREWGLE